MKTILFFLVIAVILPTLTGFVEQDRVTLKMDPQSLRLKVGEAARVDLAIEQVSGLYGAEVHLKFDPMVLEVVDADPDQGGVQIQAGTLPIPDFVVLNSADNQAGTVDYAVTQLPPNKPGQGNGVVASLTVRAKKAAVTQIQLERVLLADTAGNSINVVTQNGQVRVMGDLTWMLFVAGGVLVLGAGIGFGFAVMKRK